MYRVLSCLTTEHDLRLVAVAGIICFLASLVAIKLFRRARATAGGTRFSWIVTAGVTTGCGIWATHFIAMLSYDPGVGIAYSVWLTMLSLLAAAVVTGTGLAVSVYNPGPAGSAIGGAVVGAGVACMHYLGIEAVELPGHIHWDPTLVTSSIVVALLLGMGAMLMERRRQSVTWTFLAASGLTLAIVSHHFIAMGAIEIVPDPTQVIDTLSLSPASLATAIASVATAILSMSLVGASVDRRVREQNIRLAAALDNMSQGLGMFDDSARLILVNDRYRQMYGLSRKRLSPAARCASCSITALASEPSRAISTPTSPTPWPSFAPASRWTGSPRCVTAASITSPTGRCRAAAGFPPTRTSRTSGARTRSATAWWRRSSSASRPTSPSPHSAIAPSRC